MAKRNDIRLAYLVGRLNEATEMEWQLIESDGKVSVSPKNGDMTILPAASWYREKGSLCMCIEGFLNGIEFGKNMVTELF